MSFSPKRLEKIRTGLNISKSEAARRMNTTSMAYGRYENGDRVPSYQVIQYMAEIFGTSYEYLCCMTDDPAPGAIVVRKDLDPDLFDMMCQITDKESPLRRRLLMYYETIRHSSEDS